MDTLIAAVRGGDSSKLAQVLLEKEIIQLVNTSGANGEYALHAAARLLGKEGMECIELLLKHKAKVNVRDAKGRTPLHHAAAFGCMSAYVILAKNGGRMDVYDAEANTPVDVILRASGNTIKKYDNIYEVHTWGKGANLALGHGDSDNRAAPKKVVQLSGVDINRGSGITCSKMHTLVCTSRGDAFSWGIGNGGKLGHGDEVHRISPYMLSLGAKVTAVACSVAHSAFITFDGHIFTCGANESGQLGLGDTETRYSPKRVRWKESDAPFIVNAALSPSHTVALTSKGQIWTWGRDNEGQLGIGPSQKRFQAEPRLVPLFAGTVSLSSSAPLQAVHVAAGQGCTLVATSVHDIATFGLNRNSPVRFVLEHPRCPITKLSVSGSGTRAIAVTEAGQVFEWQPANDPPSPSRIYFPLPLFTPSSSSSSLSTSFSSTSPVRLIVRSATTTDNHILLSTDKGGVYYYEYGSAPSFSSASVASSPAPSPPPSPKPLTHTSSFRRLPIQRAISVSTSDSHSVVLAGACAPAVPLELAPSSFSADFVTLAGSMLFSDMSFSTSDGQTIPAHRVIVSRIPSLEYIDFGSTIPLGVSRSVADSFLSILYSASTHPALLDPSVTSLLNEYNSSQWVPLTSHLSKRLVDGLYSDMSVTAMDAEHPENATTLALHRVVMAARCDYFLAMSTSGMREVMPLSFDEDDCEGEGSKLESTLELPPALFEPIVTFIYSDTIHKTDSKKNKDKTIHSNTSVTFWLELLAAADQFMLAQLKTIAANMVLPLLRVHNVGNIICIANELDPYDTRLQDACLDYIRDNLDIMLVAKVLEDMPQQVLTLLDERLSQKLEEEASSSSKSKSKKIRGQFECSFTPSSFDEQGSLPSPQSSLPSPSPSSLPSSLPISTSVPISVSPSNSLGASPSRKVSKKQMKRQQHQQQLQHESEEPKEHEQPQQQSTQVEQVETQQEEPKQSLPPTPVAPEKKKKKQAMKRIVGFDADLITQALNREKAREKEKENPPAPPKPAWSTDPKTSTTTVSLLEIQKQQTHSAPTTPAKQIAKPAEAPRSAEKFTSAVTLDQFLTTKEKKQEKEKEKEKEKPFSWGSLSSTPEALLPSKPKTDLAAAFAEEQQKAAKKKKREQEKLAQQAAAQQRAAPPPPAAPTLTPATTVIPVNKPKVDLAAYMQAERSEKQMRMKAMHQPPKPLTDIVTEERFLQQITRFYAAENAAYLASQASPSPALSNNTHKKSKKSPRKKNTECVDTRPMDIKFASSC